MLFSEFYGSNNFACKLEQRQQNTGKVVECLTPKKAQLFTSKDVVIFIMEAQNYKSIYFTISMYKKL